MRIISIQPANSTTGEHNVHARLPYPYHVDELTGAVTRQDVWKGDPASVIGFQNDADIQVVDLLWMDAAADPDSIVGKFPVFVRDDGSFYSLTTPISRVSISEVSAS